MQTHELRILVLLTGGLALAGAPALAAVPARSSVLADTAAGMSAFHSGHYRRAYVRWRMAADRGGAEAEYDLGVLYAQGLGVLRDLSEATRWYRMSAEKGIPEAEFALGQMYARGWGLPRDEADALASMESASDSIDQQDSAEWDQIAGYGIAQDYGRAAYWFQKAANQGNAEAQLSLANLYAHGRGVSRDVAIAAQWCRAAAAHDDPAAQERLGVAFARGEGVPRDARQAYFWLTLASQNGDHHAGKLRADLAASLTSAEITTQNQAAADWRLRKTEIPGK